MRAANGGVVEADRADRLSRVHGLSHQPLDQVAATPVAVGHEVGKTDDARTFERQLAQRFAAGRGETLVGWAIRRPQRTAMASG